MEKIIKVPDSWAEISIEQLQELMTVESIYDKIAIIINQDSEEIRKYDTDTFNRISKALAWIHTLPNESMVSKVITIDEQEYGLDKLSNLLLGQWIDCEEYVKDSVLNIHKLMALFYRPLLTTLKDGTLILEDYDANTASERAELFLKKMNVQECYSTLVFFSLIEKSCLITIQGYFQAEIIKMKLLKENPQPKESRGLRMKRRLINGLGFNSRTT
jgi:hypothetical protein